MQSNTQMVFDKYFQVKIAFAKCKITTNQTQYNTLLKLIMIINDK